MSLANIKLYLDSGAGMELKSYLMQRVEELKNIENLFNSAKVEKLVYH